MTGSSPWRLFLDFVSSRIGNAALSLLTVVVIAHSVPVETTGTALAAIAYAVLLFGFLDLGTGPALVRNVTGGDLRRHITVYFWTRVCLTGMTTLIGLALIPLAFPAHARLAAVAAMGFVVSSIYAVSGPIGMATGNARPFRLFSLTQGALVLTGVTAAIVLIPEPTAAEIVTVYAGAALITAATAMLWVRRWLVPMPVGVALREVRANVRDVAMLGVATTAGTIYLRIDQMMVLRWAGAAASGYYGLAARVIAQARLIPSAFQMSVMGMIARRVAEPAGLSERDQHALDRIVLGGGLGLACLVIAPADLAVWVLGGDAFDDAVPLTIILAVSVVPMTFNYVVATSVVMAKNDGMYAKLVGGLLAVNVVANLFAIPAYGATGAAVVTVATELLGVSLLSTIIERKAGAANLPALAAGTALAAAAAAVKLLVIEAPWEVNLAGSLALIGGAIVALIPARHAMRELSHAHDHEAGGDAGPAPGAGGPGAGPSHGAAVPT